LLGSVLDGLLPDVQGTLVSTVKYSHQPNRRIKHRETGARLSVCLVNQENGATVASSPLTFSANVAGFVQGATVIIFLDGSQVCSGSTSSTGSFSWKSTRLVERIAGSRYASKTGLTSGTSQHGPSHSEQQNKLDRPSINWRFSHNVNGNGGGSGHCFDRVVRGLLIQNAARKTCLPPEMKNAEEKKGEGEVAGLFEP